MKLSWPSTVLMWLAWLYAAFGLNTYLNIYRINPDASFWPVVRCASLWPLIVTVTLGAVAEEEERKREGWVKLY